MSDQFKHIFDSSACLSKRQLKDYVYGTMSREECYAVEHHINTCLFCSEALEGMAQTENALVATEALNAGFLKDHFSLINPQIHLNSIAPSVTAQPINKPVKNKTRTQPFLKPSAIAAALILGLGILWYLEFNEDHHAAPAQVAQTEALQGSDRTEKNTKENIAATTTEINSSAADPAFDEGMKSAATSTPDNHSNEQKPQALLTADPKAGDQVAADTARKEESIEADKTETLKIATNVIPSPPERTNVLAINNTNDITRNKPVIRMQSADDEKEKNETSDRSIASADALYDSGKYNAALMSYKKQMNASGSRAQQYASLQAARCYINLSQNDKAVKLLQSIADNGDGSYRRQAKRLLRDIQKSGKE